MAIFLCVSSIPSCLCFHLSILCDLLYLIPSVLLLFPALECGSFSLTTGKAHIHA